MICKKFCFPQEYCEQVLEEIGKIENGVEIIDNNKEVMESKKECFLSIIRCKELEKKISKIEKICGEFNFEIKKYDNINNFYNDCDQDIKNYKNFTSSYIDIIENQIFEDESKLDDFIQAKNHLIQEITDNHEKFYSFKNLLNSLSILQNKGKKTSYGKNKVYSSEYSLDEDNKLNMNFIEEGHYEDNQLYICGVVKAEERMKFQRMIFRASFDRCNFNFIDIPEVGHKYILDLELNKVINVIRFKFQDLSIIIN